MFWEEDKNPKDNKSKSLRRPFVIYDIQLLEFVYWVMIIAWFGKRMGRQDSGMMDVDGVVYPQPPKEEQKQQI